MYGDSTIGTDRQTIDDLLEVWAVIFAVPVTKLHAQVGFAEHFPGCFDAGGVIMSLV